MGDRKGSGTRITFYHRPGEDFPYLDDASVADIEGEVEKEQLLWARRTKKLLTTN